MEYEKALRKQNYKNVNFEYKTPETKEEREQKEIKKKINREKGRDVLWFIPPYSCQVESGTTVGKKFFEILDNCFPKEHSLHKIINRNMIKQSYRTMPNFDKIIKSMNKKVMREYLHKLNEEKDNEIKNSKKNRDRPKYILKPNCNCDRSHPCPLEYNCNRTDVVYKAEIKSQNIQVDGNFYIGSACNFKSRWSNHIATFKNKEIKQDCSLKDFVWSLKERNIDFSIKWEVIKQSRSYLPGDKSCLLCLDEKIFIMDNEKNEKMINKDRFIGEKCQHRNKFLIQNWKRKRKT